MTIPTTAKALLSRFDTIVPADGDEMLELYKERGWVEALQYLSERGLLTPAGETEAARILVASGEWADGLETDVNDWPVSLPPVPADHPVIVHGPAEASDRPADDRRDCSR
jgi:hypothetical protein